MLVRATGWSSATTNDAWPLLPSAEIKAGGRARRSTTKRAYCGRQVRQRSVDTGSTGAGAGWCGPEVHEASSHLAAEAAGHRAHRGGGHRGATARSGALTWIGWGCQCMTGVVRVAKLVTVGITLAVALSGTAPGAIAALWWTALQTTVQGVVDVGEGGETCTKCVQQRYACRGVRAPRRASMQSEAHV
jgi:hypothetical protein